MGMLRKMLSVPTAGLIDFRSDKERIARTSRKTSKQAKAVRDAGADGQASEEDAILTCSLC